MLIGSIVGVFQAYFPSILYLYLVYVIFFLLQYQIENRTEPRTKPVPKPFMWLGIISSLDVFHIICEAFDTLPVNI